MVRAIALNPWPVMVSFSYPMRRSAAFTVLLLIGLAKDLTEGNTYLLAPVSCFSSVNIFDGLSAERHNMRLFHLHLFRRDVPDSLIKVNLCPFRVPKLSRAHKEHRGKP